ncbi:MAG: hypothetical protein M0R06_25365 [Sphaerochaeta sp.]|jgi:hypothetical protein|nr:hypothetical protein [Sphaerochaeta sp.]
MEQSVVEKVLTFRKDGMLQIGTVSVPKNAAEDVANALYFLLTRPQAFGKSRSEVICEAIIGHAAAEGWDPDEIEAAGG